MIINEVEGMWLHLAVTHPFNSSFSYGQDEKSASDGNAFHNHQ